MPRRSWGLFSPRVPRSRPLPIPIPLEKESRVAQISSAPPFANAQVFPRAQWPHLPAFEPGALVGYALDFMRLAQAVNDGAIETFAPGRFLLTLADCGTRVATRKFRDQVWRALPAPLFEAIVAPGGHLLALECEAHRGWHVQNGFHVAQHEGQLLYRLEHSTFASPTGFEGTLEALPCPCGRPTPRLMLLAPSKRPRAAVENGAENGALSEEALGVML